MLDDVQREAVLGMSSRDKDLDTISRNFQRRSSHIKKQSQAKRNKTPASEMMSIEDFGESHMPASMIHGYQAHKLVTPIKGRLSLNKTQMSMTQN